MELSEIGPIEMRGARTAVVSEEGAEVPLHNGEEEVVLMLREVVSGER